MSDLSSTRDEPAHCTCTGYSKWDISLSKWDMPIIACNATVAALVRCVPLPRDCDTPVVLVRFSPATGNYNKSELMLMRRARAYGSFCLQAGNLGLYPSISSLFTLLQPNIAQKLLIINIFRVQSHSRSLNDVDISKKLVASACYDKQHVCAYLQPFSR